MMCRVYVHGSEGDTVVDLNLTPSQYDGIMILAKAVTDKSTCEAEPRMYIKKILPKDKCPDCGADFTKEDVRCQVCGLSWEDIESAAEYFDRLQDKIEKHI